MKTINVKVKGIAPLLMNAYSEPEKKETEGEWNDIDFQIKKTAYFKEGVGYYLPSSHFHASMQQAAKNLRSGMKASDKNKLRAFVFIGPPEIPVVGEMSVDKRMARIPPSRAPYTKIRPRFDNWEVNFLIQFNEQRFHEGDIKKYLKEAGEACAVGDYRPEFGRFEIIEWELQAKE